MFRRSGSSKERKSVLTAPLPRRNKSHFTVLNSGQQQQQQHQHQQLQQHQQEQGATTPHGDTETTSPTLQRSSNVHDCSFESQQNQMKKMKNNSCIESKTNPCYCCEECRHCTQTQVSKRSRSSFVATIRKKFFSNKRSDRKSQHDGCEVGTDETHFMVSSNNRSLPRGWRSSHKSETLRLERSPSSSRRNRDESAFATSHKHKQVNRVNSRASCVHPDSSEGVCNCTLKNQRSEEKDPRNFHPLKSLNQNTDEATSEFIDSNANTSKQSIRFCKSSRPTSFSHPPTSLHVSKNLAPDPTGYGHASPPDSHLNDTFDDEVENAASGDGSSNAVLPYYDKVKNPSVPGWSLTGELLKLPSYGWYWGPMSRTEAEKKLSKLPNGSFLVRDSSDDRHLLSLSFRSDGRTLHTRIEHFNGMFSFYARSSSGSRDEEASSGVEAGCSSVVELIERSISDSQSGAFCYSRGRSVDSRSFPVCLSKPMSRFSKLATLQHMCRFVLRQRVRIDHLKLLPLPLSVKAWLEETQY